MVYNATFNLISVISYHGNQFYWWRKPAASHLQTLSHNVVSSTPRGVWLVLTTLVVIGTDCIGSYKLNYHTITTTTAPILQRI